MVENAEDELQIEKTIKIEAVDIGEVMTTIVSNEFEEFVVDTELFHESFPKGGHFGKTIEMENRGVVDFKGAGQWTINMVWCRSMDYN
jgi:hypothetical protein